MENQQPIAALYKCSLACNFCAASCLEEDDVKTMKDCIKLDMDCAQICTLTAALLARESEHGKHLLKECAEICGLCATECEKHGAEMVHCAACAAACRTCETVCKAAA